jgi:hypothetical protein
MGGIALAAALLAGDELSVSVSPPAASGGGTSGGAVAAVTALASGGAGAPSYAWTVLTPDPTYALTINSPAAATTSFTYAVVRVTVTDGAESVYRDVDVSFLNNSTGGGSVGGGGGGGVLNPPPGGEEN